MSAGPQGSRVQGQAAPVLPGKGNHRHCLGTLVSPSQSVTPSKACSWHMCLWGHQALCGIWGAGGGLGGGQAGVGSEVPVQTITRMPPHRASGSTNGSQRQGGGCRKGLGDTQGPQG